jgi:glycosyltransferase involved in cell wall biosynthesis
MKVVRCPCPLLMVALPNRLNEPNKLKKNNMKPFSVFIPVYNEEDILIRNTERLITYLDTLQIDYELILGSNGSTDRTSSLGGMLSDKYPQIKFFHTKEKGVGDAFRQGVQTARYDVVVSLDMDLSIHLGFIEEALGLLDADYDIIVGSKKMGHEKRSIFRKLGSDLFIFIARVLLGLPFEDYSIGAKAYSRDLLLEYLDRIDRGTAYVLNIVFLAFESKRKVIEIPVRCEDYRQSRFNIIYEGFYRFFNLFKLWYVEKSK